MTLGIALLVLISVLVFATGFISATYEMRDKTEPRFWRSLTSSGRLVLVLTILVLILTGVQYIYTQHQAQTEANTRDSVIRADYAKSVEAITTRYDSNTNNLKDRYDTSTSNIFKALAEYGLKYDSAEKRIEKLVRDSANRKTTIIQGENPFVGFCDNSKGLEFKRLSGDTLLYYINICSHSAPAIVKKAYAHLILSNYSFTLFEKIQGLKYYSTHRILSENLSIAKDKGKAHYLYAAGKDVANTKTVVLCITIVYTDSYGKNEQTTRQIGLLDITKNEFSILVSQFAQPVIDVLKSNGIDYKLD